MKRVLTKTIQMMKMIQMVKTMEMIKGGRKLRGADHASSLERPKERHCWSEIFSRKNESLAPSDSKSVLLECACAVKKLLEWKIAKSLGREP